MEFTYPEETPGNRVGRSRDIALVARMATGDEGAFRAFYRRHYPVAFHVALRVVRDRGLAEDAVQEGFLVAWQQSGRYSPSRAKPSTWLLTFVHRRAVDLVRTADRRSADPLELVPSEYLGVDDHAIDEVVGDTWVQQALDRLPPAEREVIELAYLQGLTQAQIAQLKQVPLGTVKSRTFVALRRLQAAAA